VEQDGGSPGGVIAGGAVAAGVAFFAATRLLSGGPTLEALQADAIPLNDALRNSKPTLVEFYANWCAPIAASSPRPPRLIDTPQVCQQSFSGLQFSFGCIT
jgi:thiol-disulfide isomerase/thioredoxin